MATVFKSDKVATASMGNINGIKGPQDFALFLDFENGIYESKVHCRIGSLEKMQINSPVRGS